MSSVISGAALAATSEDHKDLSAFTSEIVRRLVVRLAAAAEVIFPKRLGINKWWEPAEAVRTHTE